MKRIYVEWTDERGNRRNGNIIGNGPLWVYTLEGWIGIRPEWVTKVELKP